MKKEDGFTLVEILAVVVLLALLLSLIWNVIVQNAFQQKRVQDEMEIQNSAKALLNSIGEIVMEQNTPVVSEIDGDSFTVDTAYTVSSKLIFNDGTGLIKLNNTEFMIYGDDENGNYFEKEYKGISTVFVIVKNNGLMVIVRGQSDDGRAKVEFKSTFYTRNS